MHERLHVFEDEQGVQVAKLRIFPQCVNLIRTLPQLRYDEKRINDVATEPHELTHGPDAIRGWCVYWTLVSRTPAKPVRSDWTRDMLEDYQRGSESERRMMLELWGPHP